MTGEELLKLVEKLCFEKTNTQRKNALIVEYLLTEEQKQFLRGLNDEYHNRTYSSTK